MLMALFRKEYGMIFDDNFMEDSGLWTYSPSGNCTLDTVGGVIRLRHGVTSDTRMLTNLPNERTLLMEVTATYVPTEDDDTGGLLIWRDAVNKLEFLESKDTIDGDYRIWRAVKDGNQWKFFAKKNNGWEFFDSAPFTATMAGVILKAAPDGLINQDILVDRVVVCKGTKVQVGNIDAGRRVDLCNRIGDVIDSRTASSSSTGAEFELPSVPFRGSLKLYGADDLLVDQTDVIDIYGGDVFLCGADLHVIWNSHELDRYNANSIGPLYDDTLVVRMSVFNPVVPLAKNVTLAVMKYQQEFGYEWADVARDMAGSPAAFGDNASLGDIPINESRDFYVRFTREDANLFSMKPAQFVVDVSYD
jgi:hypothetical protein